VLRYSQRLGGRKCHRERKYSLIRRQHSSALQILLPHSSIRLLADVPCVHALYDIRLPVNPVNEIRLDLLGLLYRCCWLMVLRQWWSSVGNLLDILAARFRKMFVSVTAYATGPNVLRCRLSTCQESVYLSSANGANASQHRFGELDMQPASKTIKSRGLFKKWLSSLELVTSDSDSSNVL
jgi:hypothetical protein